MTSRETKKREPQDPNFDDLKEIGEELLEVGSKAVDLAGEAASLVGKLIIDKAKLDERLEQGKDLVEKGLQKLNQTIVPENTTQNDPDTQECDDTKEGDDRFRLVEMLERLQRLRQIGILTEEEFNEEKGRLLNGLAP